MWWLYTWNGHRVYAARGYEGQLICSQAWPTGTDPRPGETINLTGLAATVSGQEVSEAVVELIAEKLGIVGRATEDGSLGWKLLLQHVADDAKGASGNLAR